MLLRLHSKNGNDVGLSMQVPVALTSKPGGCQSVTFSKRSQWSYHLNNNDTGMDFFNL